MLMRIIELIKKNYKLLLVVIMIFYFFSNNLGINETFESTDWIYKREATYENDEYIILNGKSTRGKILKLHELSNNFTCNFSYYREKNPDNLWVGFHLKEDTGFSYGTENGIKCGSDFYRNSSYLTVKGHTVVTKNEAPGKNVWHNCSLKYNKGVIKYYVDNELYLEYEGEPNDFEHHYFGFGGWTGDAAGKLRVKDIEIIDHVKEAQEKVQQEIKEAQEKKEQEEQEKKEQEERNEKMKKYMMYGGVVLLIFGIAATQFV
jgi:hypothetical protein